MNRRQQILIGVIGGVIGVALVGVAARERIYRRLFERRYHEAVEEHRKLERHVNEVLATHERLKNDLTQEQQRSRELSDALAATRGRLEEITGRLTEENQNVRKLHMRLAAMQQQMDQLQGELAVTLQERQQAAATKGTAPIQLERVVVSDEASTKLHGRVMSIHTDWGFVVISLGWDAVRIGDTVSIFRDQQLLAKARVERVQENICAATVLPEWNADAVRVNDLARVL